MNEFTQSMINHAGVKPSQTSNAASQHELNYSEKEMKNDGDRSNQICDILLKMRDLETNTYSNRERKKVLKLTDLRVWRTGMIDWMYQVVKACKLRVETVPAAAYYIDVAISRKVFVCARELQIGGMAALYLALKCYDSTAGMNRILQLSTFVQLGDGLFTEQDVIDMERRLLNALNWKLHPPTPNCFLEQYMELFPNHVEPHVKTQIKEMSLALIQHAVTQMDFILMEPSVLSFVAILMAIDRVEESEFPLSQCHNFLLDVFVAANLDYTSLHVMQAWHKLQESVRKEMTRLNENVEREGGSNNDGMKSPLFEHRGKLQYIRNDGTERGSQSPKSFFMSNSISSIMVDHHPFLWC